MSKVDFAALIALCAALASAIGAGHDVVLRDEAMSNRQLRRAAQEFS